MATTPLASVFSAAQMIRTGQEQLKQSLAELDKDALVDVVTQLVVEEQHAGNLGRIGVIARPTPSPANTTQPSPSKPDLRKTIAPAAPPGKELSERHLVTKDGKPSLPWAIALVLKDASEPMAAKDVAEELKARDWLPGEMPNPGSAVWQVFQAEKGLFTRVGRGRYGRYKLIQGLEVPDTVDDAPKQSSTQVSKAAAPSRETPAHLLNRVVKLLAKHPEGLRAEKIREHLKVSAQDMPRPLKDGLKTNTLKKQGQKRATTYTLVNAEGVSAAPTETSESTTDPDFRGKVIKVLQKVSEPITVRDIVKAAKLSNHKQVNFLLMHMDKQHQAVRKLKKRSEGGQVLWEVSPEGLKSYIQTLN